METFQLYEIINKSNTAASKAPDDVHEIAARIGFVPIDIRRRWEGRNFFKRVYSYFPNKLDWDIAYNKIPMDSVVLLQHPFWRKSKERELILQKLKNEKNVKFICLIHDVESLRPAGTNEYLKHEFDFMLSIADVLVVHNDRMKEYFVHEIEVDERKVITLQIFDYLTENNQTTAEYSNCINIAGNLNAEKAGYLKKLSDLKEVHFDLYGVGYNLSISPNITYHGSFPSNEICKHINRGFGLVWDGDSIETCSGRTGNYLKYNNPHKLSLYLASGIPVIVWKESAEADFVISNNLGITVDSLGELEETIQKIDVGKYKIMVDNVKEIANRLRNGFYTEEALGKSVNELTHAQVIEESK